MISRKGVFDVQLPPELRTRRREKVTMTISISITGIDEMEGKSGAKFIDKLMEEAGDKFKKFSRKRFEKVGED